MVDRLLCLLFGHPAAYAVHHGTFALMIVEGPPAAGPTLGIKPGTWHQWSAYRCTRCRRTVAL